MFRHLIANNTLQDWGLAWIAAGAFMLALYVLRRLVLQRLKRIATTTETIVDDFLVDVLSATHILLAAAFGLYIGTHFLNLPPTLEKLIDRTFVAMMILQVGLWANRGLVFYLDRRFARGESGQEGARAMTQSLLTFLGRAVLWGLVVLLILDNMGLNVTTLLASLGIGGIAVALAVQNILGDLLASLSISIDKPFVIGDFIILDDLMGTVEHVGLKTTRVRSLSGEQLIISNNDMLKSRIRNYKRMQERRVVVPIGVTYDTAVDKLQNIPALLRQAIEAQAQTRFDRAHFKGFGAFSLDFEAVYFVLNPDYNCFMDIQQAINLSVVRAFNQHQIEFAFPTQTLHVNGRLSAMPVAV